MRLWGVTASCLHGLIELEITAGVIIRNVLDHTSQCLAVIGKQSFLYIVTKEVAEDTTEILMARIAQERAAIGEHTYETREQTKY